MMDDRHYMRDYPRSPGRSASFILIIVLTATFALQQINAVYIGVKLDDWLELSPKGLARGFVWQLVTFQFLHAGLFHLLVNLVFLWMFGRQVEERLGTASMLKIYFGGGLAGGLLQVMLGALLPTPFGASVVGASAGICALVAACCLLEPDGVFLAFFVLPVKAIHFLIILLGIAIFFTFVPSNPGVAHAAHLGGLLLGIACIRWNLQNLDPLAALWRLRAPRPRRELVKTSAAGRTFWQKPEPVPTPIEDDLPPAEFISREVDPILDKISAHGIQSLTARERRVLEQARAKMSKR